MGAAKERKDIFQKTRIVPRGPQEDKPEPSIRNQRKDLRCRLLPEDHPKEPFRPKGPRLANDHPSTRRLHKAMRLVGGVKVFQGCRLELGNEEKENMKDQKELKPNLRTTEAELRCNQRHHLFTWERRKGSQGLLCNTNSGSIL